jgi:hypothetical protein
LDNGFYGFFAGALEVGVLISYVLLGVTITQTYIYYSRFPRDPRKLKVLVCGTTKRRALTDVLLSWVAFVWYASQPVECAYAPEFVISVCEIAHAICIGHTLYVWTISVYMHPESIFNFSPQSLVTTIFFSSLIAACGMLMYQCSWTMLAQSP